MSTGLLIIRLAVGILFAMHGAGKLFGWFGAGFGVRGTAGYLEGFGFRPGVAYALLVGATELLAGLLFSTGILMPLAGAAIVGVMFTAARTDHRGKGPWIFNSGWEYVLTIAAAAVAVVCTGPGDISVDGVIGLHASGPGWAAAALAAGVLGSAFALTTRTTSPAESPALSSVA